MKVTAVIVAAGRGSRMGMNRNKLLLLVNGKTIVEHTLDRLYYHNRIGRLVVVHSEEDAEFFRRLNAERYDGQLILTAGGITRALSVRRGLEACPPGTDIALIHDGARPFVPNEVIDRCIDSADEFGTGVAAVPVNDTVGDLSGYREEIVGYLKREKMVLIQTPQAFRFDAILGAYRQLNETLNFPDDSSVYLKYCGKPRHCLGSPLNVKITYREDLARFPKSREETLRVGAGFDAHRCDPARPLIVGGVEIPNAPGLAGHSDADALTHAILDSLLSALGRPDIGSLFPDSDPAYAGVSSLLLAEKVAGIMEADRARVVNVSAVLVAEAPKFAPYLAEMKRRLGDALGISPDRVCLTCTTTEGMGFAGRREGIAVTATSLVSFG